MIQQKIAFAASLLCARFSWPTRFCWSRRADDARDLVGYKGPAAGKTDRFVLVLRKS
jgi:hypothetical protein